MRGGVRNINRKKNNKSNYKFKVSMNNISSNMDSYKGWIIKHIRFK